MDQVIIILETILTLKFHKFGLTAQTTFLPTLPLSWASLDTFLRGRAEIVTSSMYASDVVVIY
jgi:hypothetical protein